MMDQIIAHDLFMRIFNITPRIPWCKDWGNGTGYLPGAVIGPTAPSLTPGDMVASISNRGRRVIIVGTPYDNVVVFERKTLHTHSKLAICCNHILLPTTPSALTYNDVIRYLGDGIENGRLNLGLHISNLI